MQDKVCKRKIEAEEKFEILVNEFRQAFKKYKSKKITEKNYNIPRIYLTEEEVKEANKELEKFGIKMRILPLNEKFEQQSEEAKKLRVLEEKFSENEISMIYSQDKNKAKK